VLAIAGILMLIPAGSGNYYRWKDRLPGTNLRSDIFLSGSHSWTCENSKVSWDCYHDSCEENRRRRREGLAEQQVSNDFLR
jgi:hypothetical protein